MKLSNQAMGALMMALQKSLMEQSDITGLLQQLDFAMDKNEQLVVENPPILRYAASDEDGEKVMPKEEDPYGNA
tara:strand:+ start:678 stop:899 length:222 start_codon:yes stop_codon:yes gene_type:complete